MKYKQYSTVRLKKIIKTFDKNELSFWKKAPEVGDVAVIVEIYEKPSLGYELECIDKNGDTQWVLAFSPEEAEFELLSENT